MTQFRVPTRRPRRRFYRYRPKNGSASGGWNRWLRCGLLILAALCLSFFLASVIRSIRTARQTEAYAQWRREAESSSAAAAVLNTDTIVRMTKPDGSPITREDKRQSGLTATDAVVDTKFHKASGDPLPEMAEMRKVNRDLTAWLTIDQVLDLPVVYRDNSWYLNHDFEGRKNAAGTLFLDVNHPVTERTQNLLIHGHNMKDGSMFAQLTHYLKKSYWKKHPFISLSTMWEKESYVIFAVMEVADQPGDPGYVNTISHPNFSSDQEFNAYLKEVRSHSALSCPLSVKPEDALLTMSTCIGDHHLVVLARRFRNDESKTSLKRMLEI